MVGAGAGRTGVTGGGHDPAFDAAMRRVERWVGEFGGAILAVARAHTDSELDAHDVVSESWEVVLARWDRLPPDARARGWVVGITMNVARARRRNDRRRREIVEEDPSRFAIATDARQTPVEVRMLVDEMWRAIGELPELQRSVVLHRLFDGMSTRETAHAMLRTEGTVKTSLFRALHTLRERLGPNLEAALERITTRPEEDHP